MKNLKEEDFEKRVAPKGTEHVCLLCDLNGIDCWNIIDKWSSNCEGHDDREYFVKKQPVDQSPAPITHETDIEYLREAVDRLTKDDKRIVDAVLAFAKRCGEDIVKLEKQVKKLKRKIKKMSKLKSKKGQVRHSIINQ